jgi:hypothetical protein
MPYGRNRLSLSCALPAGVLLLFSVGCATQQAQRGAAEVLLFSEMGNQFLQDSVAVIEPDGANFKLLLPRQANRSFLYAHGNSTGTHLLVIAHELMPNNQFEDHLFLYVPRTGKFNRVLSQPGDAGVASLAPDDGRIAFGFVPPGQGGQVQLWITDLAGQARALTGAPNQLDEFPVWRPDGSEIWFLRVQFVAGRVDSSLMKISPAGGSPAVVFGPSEHVGAVAFSPDNARFAMWTPRGLEIVDASTLARNVVLSTSALPDLVLQSGSLAWSRKQDLLALALVNTQTGASELWTVATDGSSARPIYHVNDGRLYLGGFAEQ